ncbi:MAG: hypothetical protein V1709_09705 [Planctomycetota bacterium]
MDSQQLVKLYTDMRLLESYLVETLEQVKKVNELLKETMIKKSS